MSKTSKFKLAQSQHAASAAHCTNHYTRSVMQLESVVEERLAQLSLLVQENSELKRREAALQSAVSSLAGSVSAATKAVLVSSSVDAADALHATFRPASPDVRFSISDYKGFLLRMQQREAAVQRIMSQLGHVESEELYSSWLLRRAFSSPQRAAQHLAMSKAERVAFVLGTVQKMGLLIGKYDLLHHPRTSSGTPREQLDALVDDLNERTLAFCLLAPPTRQLEMACLNMDTGQPEPYPQGWWAVVIDAMQLTDNQKAALKICWDKVKPIKLALTAKYEALSAQLAQLQQKQLDQQRQFELQAEHAIDAAISRNAQREQQRQQKQQHDVQLQAQMMQQQQMQAQVMQQQQQWQQQQWQQQQWQQQQQQQQQQYPQQQQWQACSQNPQQQQQQQQQMLPMQPPLERKASLVESLTHDQDLFQFCRALLSSELQGNDGMLDSQGVKDNACFATTATCAPLAALPGCIFGSPAATGTATANGMACGMQFDLSAAAPAAVAMTVQQQVYASRLAPLQQTQQQRQFMQFSPAVAAAAAASDQNLWLGGLSPTLGAPSPGSNGPHGLSTVPQSSDSLQDPSNGLKTLEDSEGMLVDAVTDQPSTSSTGAPITSKSLDYTSEVSKGVSSPTSAGDVSQSTEGTAAAAAGAVSASAAAAAAAASGKDHEFWQQLAAGCVPGAAAVKADPEGASGKPHMVLQTTGHEQCKLERRLDRITAQLKMQQYCMHTYVLNICSKKQMALKYVNCYPWVPESFSMAEALDDMGW